MKLGMLKNLQMSGNGKNGDIRLLVLYKHIKLIKCQIHIFSFSCLLREFCVRGQFIFSLVIVTQTLFP